MRLSYSRLKAYKECPALYEERYVHGRELALDTSSGLAFGKRVHTMLAEHLRPSIRINTEFLERGLEDEAREMLAAYVAHYPVEPFDVVDVERKWEVPLNENHVLIGIFDAIVRDKESNQLEILEHKTERRGSKDNDPRAWATREQVSLYLWAAQKIYGEPFRDILLNVLTRASEKKEKPAGFSRQRLVREDWQLQESVADAIRIADAIERDLAEGHFTHNRDQCYKMWPCPYRDLHIVQTPTAELLAKYSRREEYLGI